MLNKYQNFTFYNDTVSIGKLFNDQSYYELCKQKLI